MDHHFEEVVVHSPLLGAFEKIVDRMRGSSLRSDDLWKQLLAIVELSSREHLVRPQAQPNEMVLRVGSLELDLIDRTAERDGRQIDLLPREFQLLKYMMQRSDQLVTRANLSKTYGITSSFLERTLSMFIWADCAARLTGQMKHR